MFINTISYERMLEDTCKYFKITPDELTKSLRKIKSKVDEGEDEDQLLNNYLDYLSDQIDGKILDEILFFHLSRRLNDTTDTELDKETKNIYDLLSQQSPISDFLKQYGIEFKKSDEGHLDVIDKGTVVDLNSISNFSIPNLKGRLGYKENGIDYAVNGFAFNVTKYKDKNNYFKNLSICPEFISVLSSILGEKSKIVNDYKEKSTYYCYVYLVPLAHVIFDGCDNYNNKQKIHFLFENILSNIYYNINFRNNDYANNPIIRLEDDKNMPAKYFLGNFTVRQPHISNYALEKSVFLSTFVNFRLVMFRNVCYNDMGGLPYG